MEKSSRAFRVLDTIGLILIVVAVFLIGLGYFGAIYLKGVRELHDVVKPSSFGNYIMVFIILVPGILIRWIAARKKDHTGESIMNWSIKIWLSVAGGSIGIYLITVLYLDGFSSLQKTLNPFNLRYYLPTFIVIFGPLVLFYGLFSIIFKNKKDTVNNSK